MKNVDVTLAICIGALVGAFLLPPISCKPNVPKALTTPLAGASSNVALECEVDVHKELCTELKQVACAKVASCSGTNYEDCRTAYTKTSTCLNKDMREISRCLQDFASIKCNEDLPVSCFTILD